MDEEKMKKLSYINENIIEKGYNPEDVSNFVIIIILMLILRIQIKINSL